MGASVSELPRASVDRITVGLTRRVTEELAQLADESGLSKTDIVNRAISLYRLTTQKIEGGEYELAFVKRNGDLELVHIL